MYIEEQRLKRNFEFYFRDLMDKEGIMLFFYEIFVIGTAYVVGGFFRDFLLGKASRDVDIMVDISTDKLIEIIQKVNLSYSINRHGGIKIKMQNLELDIWSIENNWAFKNNLVKLNENDRLNSIAKGCFYNYDSLVINLHNFSYNLRYYKDFLKTNKLNILQANSVYKNQNPSIEANILRAFYIKYKFKSAFTDNTALYLQSKLGYIQDNYTNILERLVEVKMCYPKYEELTIDQLEKDIFNIMRYNINCQQRFDF